MFKLPFKCLPSAWGLKGKTRAIAEAEYNLTGYELEVELLKINADLYNEKDLKKRSADIELKYNKITETDHNIIYANLLESERAKELALLEIKYKSRSILETEYNKGIANIKKEPWVTVLNLGVSKDKTLEGSFELDWNDFFIEELRSKGYTGTTDESVVNQWFMEICKNVVAEEIADEGYVPDPESNLETMRNWTHTTPPGKKAYS